jgi:hypothetical protein
MSKDMTNDLLKAVVAHADGQIEKHKVNVLVQCKNSVGVAEHGDHVETIQKEMEQIAHYEDIKDVVRKHFSDYTDRTTLTE